MKIGIIVSNFHREITQALLDTALATFEKEGITKQAIEVIRVPGAFEIPHVAMRGAQEQRWDIILCFGCVVRGETQHFDYVCNEVARGLMDVSTTTRVPALFEVLTTENMQQARVRAGLEPASNYGEKPIINKGHAGALAALDMLALLKEWTK